MRIFPTCAAMLILAISVGASTDIQTDDNSDILNMETEKPNHKETIVKDLKTLEAEFAKSFPGPFTVDVKNKKKLGRFIEHPLKSGDLSLNDNSILDEFVKKNNADVAIFVKSGDEFVSISSSFIKEDGTSSRGNILDHMSQAYRSLINRSSYSGKVVLFRKEYKAQYSLIKNSNGQPIGAYLIATPLSN